MASSTTRPMASTRPNSESVLMEKPNSGNRANVPISDTGTASSGISVARQPCRKMNTTRMTSTMRLHQRVLDFLHAFRHRQRGVERDHVIQVGREAFLQLRHELLGAVGGVDGVGIRATGRGR